MFKIWPGAIAILLLALAIVPAQITSPNMANSDQKNLIVTAEHFNDLQRLLDDFATPGKRISDVRFHSKLFSRSSLKIEFQDNGSKDVYQYRPIFTEFNTASLQQEMNAAGSEGFRLVTKTPVIIEPGFSQIDDRFFAIMEKTSGSHSAYKYVVLSYSNIYRAKDRIRKSKDLGFYEVNKIRDGRSEFLILESPK